LKNRGSEFITPTSIAFSVIESRIQCSESQVTSEFTARSYHIIIIIFV